MTAQGLTGLYGQVGVLDPTIWRASFYQWRNQHFDPADVNGWSWRLKPGAERKLLRDIRPLVHQIKPGEYEKELPDVVTTPVRVDMPADARALYDELRQKLVLKLAGGGTVEAGSAGALSNKLRQLAGGFLYDENGDTQWLHDAKLDAAADILEDADSPVLVLYAYRAEAEALQERAPGPILGGGSDQSDQDAAIKGWNDGKLRVMYGHPASMGHGLNLQHGGHTLLWYSLPWSWEMFEQSRARLLRSGQRHTVFEHVLMATNTVEAHVLDALRGHADVATRVEEALRT
jgi:hypothetical protein